MTADYFVAGGAECSAAGGAESIGAHSWLVLHIAIPVLFVFFLILANGAMWSP